MPDATQDAPVRTLLFDGLHRFSRGDREGANACWGKVLEHEPDHLAATDYRTYSSVELPDVDAVTALVDAAKQDEDGTYIGDAETLVREVKTRIKERKLESAMQLLQEARQNAADVVTDRLARIAILLRHLLTLRYLVALGPFEQPVRAEGTDVGQTLTGEAMHVLALVDVNSSRGQLTVGDLVADSLYGPYKTLRALILLRHHGLISTGEAGDEPETYVVGDGALEAVSEPVPDAYDVGAGGDDATHADASASPDASAPADGQDVAAAEPERETEDEPAVVETAPALTTTEDATEDASDDAYPHVFRKGVSAYVQGEFKKAREFFQRCREMRPDDPRPKQNLERLDAAKR